jgi:hypothetical protein
VVNSRRAATHFIIIFFQSIFYIKGEALSAAFGDLPLVPTYSMTEQVRMMSMMVNVIL